MEFRSKYEDRCAMKRKVLLQLKDQITRMLPFPMISQEKAQEAWQLAFDGVHRKQFRTIEQIWTYIVTKAKFDSFPYFHGMQHENYSFKVIAARLATMLENYIESSEMLTEKNYSFLESQDVEEETDYVRQKISQFLSQRLQKVEISFKDCEILALELMHFLTDRGMMSRLMRSTGKISEFLRYWRYTRMEIFDILEDLADSVKDLKTKINQSVTTDVQADKKELSLKKSAVRKVEQTHESFKFHLTTVLDNFFYHLTEGYELEDDAPYFYHTMKTTRKTQRGEMVVIDGKSSKDGSETKPTPDGELKVVESSTDDQPIAPKPPSDEKLEVGSTSDCIPEAQPPSIDDIFNQAKHVKGFQGMYKVDGEDGKPFIVVNTYNDQDHSVENFLKTEYTDWWGKGIFEVVEQDHAIKHLVHCGSGVHYQNGKLGSIACLANDKSGKFYAITAQQNFECSKGIHHRTDIVVKYDKEEDLKILGNDVKGVYDTFDKSFVDIAAVELSEECLETLDEQKLSHLTECYNDDQADLEEVTVAKVGASSGMTKGVIIGTRYHVVSRTTDEGKEQACRNLVMIESMQEGNFASAGDSGSLVYRENSRQPIGIVTLEQKINIVNARKETKQIHVVLAFRLQTGLNALTNRHGLALQPCRAYNNVIQYVADRIKSCTGNASENQKDSQALHKEHGSEQEELLSDNEKGRKENLSILPEKNTIVHARDISCDPDPAYVDYDCAIPNEKRTEEDFDWDPEAFLMRVSENRKLNLDWNPDLYIKRITEECERLPGIHGIYLKEYTMKVVVDIEPTSSEQTKATFIDIFEKELDLDNIEFHVHDNTTEYLISGEKLEVVAAVAGAGNDEGTVACLGETSGSNHLQLLSAKHIFNEERGAHREEGVFQSVIDGETTHVSSEYRGILDILEINKKEKEKKSSKEKVIFGLKAVDFAVLDLLPSIEENLNSPKLYNVNQYFEGEDEDLSGRVVKYGAVTNETHGTLIIPYYVKPKDKTGEYFVVRSDREVSPFAVEGDSGALIWKRQGKPIGIVVQRKKLYSNGEKFKAVLGVRLDNCIELFNKKFDCLIQRLKIYDPKPSMLEMSLVTPYDDLSKLTRKTWAWRVVKETELRNQSSLQAPWLRYVNFQLYVCAKGIELFDLELNSLGILPVCDQTDVIDVAELPDKHLIVSSRNSLFYTEPTGTVLEPLDKGTFTCVQYNDGKVYALTTESSGGVTASAAKLKVILVYSRKPSWIIKSYKYSNEQWVQQKMKIPRQIDYERSPNFHITQEFIYFTDGQCLYKVVRKTAEVIPQRLEDVAADLLTSQRHHDGKYLYKKVRKTPQVIPQILKNVPRDLRMSQRHHVICHGDGADAMLVCQPGLYVIRDGGSCSTVMFAEDKPFRPVSALFVRDTLYITTDDHRLLLLKASQEIPASQKIPAS